MQDGLEVTPNFNRQYVKRNNCKSEALFQRFSLHISLITHYTLNLIKTTEFSISQNLDHI